MGSRDIRGKNEKKPKKKDLKDAQAPISSLLGSSTTPVVEVIKKKKKHTWSEE